MHPGDCFTVSPGTGPIIGQPVRLDVPLIRKLGIFLSILSSVFAGLGYGSDSWLLFKTDEDLFLHSGLFKMCFSGMCFSLVASLINEPLWIVQVLLGFLGIVFMVISTLKKLRTTFPHATSNLKFQVGVDAVCSAIGTVCMGALVGIFVSTTIGGVSSAQVVYFWSFYVFAAGTVSGAISTILRAMFYQSLNPQSSTFQSTPV